MRAAGAVPSIWLEQQGRIGRPGDTNQDFLQFVGGAQSETSGAHCSAETLLVRVFGDEAFGGVECTIAPLE
ncbi:MAG: hypothetical protein GX610_14525 [Rhodococcus sp.]|nr:hypothetical protein [Rhodococcus sp. (in: high G+C Gram-positive bacteria)]